MRETTRFVATCCRWPQDQAARDAVVRAAARVEDWTGMRATVVRHRVAPLVHAATRDVEAIPADFRTWLKAEAQAKTLHAMQFTRDCLVLDAALKDRGIEPLHFKGPVLAQMAYDNVGMKFSRDLDVFVPAGQARDAFAVLEREGYRALVPGGKVSEAQAGALIRNCKDLKFLGANGTMVELHWRMSHIKKQFSSAENDPDRQSVRVAGVGELMTLSAAQTVPYLCMHGAKHHWMRLKWLADVAAYLTQLPDDLRTQILSQPQGPSQRDAMDQALALCDTYFGTQYRPNLSPRAEALYRYAMARIDQPMSEQRSALGDWTLIRDVAATRHLYASPLAALWSMRGHLIGQEDVVALPLPGYLNGLYPIIRVPSYLVRRVKGALSRRQPQA